MRLKTPIAQHRLVLYGARILKIQLEPIAALPPDHAALLRHYFIIRGRLFTNERGHVLIRPERGVGRDGAGS